MDNVNEFLAASILDIQDTIRAIDLKISALLVTVFLPFSKLGRVFAHLNYINMNDYHATYLVVTVLFFLSWLFLIATLLMGLSGTDNPSKHIVNHQNYQGSYYLGNSYTFGLLDCLFNRDLIKANKDVEAIRLKLPKTRIEIEAELVFEQLKLVYIRDVKLHRLKWAIRTGLIWFFTGLFIYGFSKSI